MQCKLRGRGYGPKTTNTVLCVICDGAQPPQTNTRVTSAVQWGTMHCCFRNAIHTHNEGLGRRFSEHWAILSPLPLLLLLASPLLLVLLQLR